MQAFVEKYVQGCNTCAQKKHHWHPRVVTIPLEALSVLWEEVGVDLITNLPLSAEYNAILVCIDLYSKMIHAISCTSNIDAMGVADLYYQEIFRLHSLLLCLISDREPQFVAMLMQKLLARMNIKSRVRRRTISMKVIGLNIGASVRDCSGGS